MHLIAAAASAIVSPPHSGFHVRGQTRGFEGWYHRLTLPEASFAWIYSIYDPEDAASSRHGVGMQILGPGGNGPLYRTGPASDRFWADEHSLALGHVFEGVAFRKPQNRAAFQRFVQSGFQLSSEVHQGVTTDEDGQRVAWYYRVTPKFGWGGGADAKQYSTAGWLAALPIFEPHYQILMAHGEASGAVEWRGRTFEFRDAPCYAEKNWGQASFPSRWFWVQCNSFGGGAGDAGGAGATLTCAGGARANPLLPGREEDVALVAVHTADGRFFPFPNIEWRVAPWGRWELDGSFEDTRISVRASCDDGDDGVRVLCPTADGMQPTSRETFDGRLSVRLWRVGSGGAEETIWQAETSQAALEVGGEPWEGDGWEGSCAVSPAAARLLAADVPLERVKEWIPGL